MCQTKICTNCNEEKEIEFFGKSKRTRDEKQHHCKACVNLKKATLNSKRIIKKHSENDNKSCSICKIVKKFSDFSNCSSYPDGKMYDCKECRKKYYTPKVEGIMIFTDIQERICNKCNTIKPFGEFLKAKTTTGINSVCKICIVNERKKVKKETKIIPEHKVCTKCEIKKVRESFVKDASKKDGLSCVCKTCTNRHKVDRCKTDYLYKMTNNIRKSVSSGFKNFTKSNVFKGKKTEIIVGISFLDLKINLEKQFIFWMDWGKNYGKYNSNLNFGFDIDHIIPISYAKTKEELYLLNHWSNFQPLCSKINRDTKKAIVYPCTNLELRITFWEDYYEYI